MRNWTSILLSLTAAAALAGEPVITCEPRELRGVPGQPLQLEITITADRASPIQLRIPRIENLHLRTVEKIPIQRTKEGRYTQKRILIWQGLETGSVTLTNLAVVFHSTAEKEADAITMATNEVKKPTLENSSTNFPTIGKENDALTQSVPTIGKEKGALTQSVPSIGIIIDAVEPAKPPVKKKTDDNPATPPMEENAQTSFQNPLLRRGAGTAGWVQRFLGEII